MRCITLFSFLGFVSFFSNAQNFNLVTSLDESISESSGLLYINEKIVTHNDAGGIAALYEISPVNGSVIKITTVTNATNVDWEDMTRDNQYIYIGDFGNVSGDRTDLKIYRISISDYIDTTNNTVTADIINYKYANQTDFTPSLFATNYDAEALISYGDDLYIFTKNWVDQQTNIYSVPKLPGSYSAVLIDNLDSQGLITAATHNADSGQILLAGYTLTTPFVITLSNFSNGFFSNGSIDRSELPTPSGYSMQVEAISFKSENQYYLTAEKGMFNESSGLYTFISSILGSERYKKNKSSILPNPATSEIEIITDRFYSVEIFDAKGTLLLNSIEKKLSVFNLKKGVYFLKIRHEKYGSPVLQRLVVR